MGFGFNLLMIFFVVPLTAMLLLIWLLTRKRIFGIVLAVIWLVILSVVFFVSMVHLVLDKILLEKEDYYGEYIVDREFFPGKQADWQYNSFRFEIKSNDSIYFYETNQEQVQKIYKGKVSTTNVYASERLILHMADSSQHHILFSNPTTYRSTWSFFLVFNSPKFNNMYFRKGEWERIQE